MDTKKVWFVTGASKGLGLSLVQKLLQDGFRVAATSRSIALLTAVAGAASETFLPLEVSLTDNDSVKAAIDKTLAHFGQIDVVVNNAGYGQTGTLEELTDAEAKANFDVNVFGTLHAIRNVMPQLRAQQSGHIFNIASIGGFFAGFPGWGIYCATKFAVAGLTESLAAEAAEFGIKATVVYPGYFRTDFLSEGSLRTAKNPIAAYGLARQSENDHQNGINGNQSNDPEKAAAVLIAISQEAQPPVHLMLGNDAYDMMHKKIALISDDAEQWNSYGRSTAF